MRFTFESYGAANRNAYFLSIFAAKVWVTILPLRIQNVSVAKGTSNFGALPDQTI